MSEREKNTDDASDPEKPATVYRRRPLTVIWVLPVLALLTAGWFLWSSLSARGPEITIRFDTADGLEAGKSEIKHKDVVLGTVTTLRPVDNFGHIVVTARMNRLSEDYLKTDTKFWIVRPRVSVQGITGLNTLLSGAYIELSPGAGEAQEAFTGLETPPLVSPDAKGKMFTLLTGDLGTLAQGSSVIYHGMKVGEIVGYELKTGNQPVSVQIFINDPYTNLIFADTRFWNASGVDVSVGVQGLKIAARSLQTIFLGGVMFDRLENHAPGAPAKPGESFALFADRHAAEDSLYTLKVRYLLHPEGSIVGVDPDDQVTMFGEKIGEVIDAHVEFDVAAGKARPVVTIALEPERLSFVGLDTADRDLTARTLALFQRLAGQGVRAQLISSNLLTGDKQIDFDYVPDAPAAKVVASGEMPEFPTAPGNDLNGLIRSAKKALGSVDTLVSSPDLKHAIHELDQSLTNINGITRQTNDQIGPLLTQLRSFAESADATVKKVGSSADGGGDLPGALRELRGAARSVRTLADYLENHPESLLRGKSK